MRGLRSFRRNSGTRRPHILFVVLVKDNEPWSRYTIRSVASQEGEFDRDLLVIDFGSSDGAMRTVTNEIAGHRGRFHRIEVRDQPVSEAFAQTREITDLMTSTNCSHISVIRSCDFLVDRRRTQHMIDALAGSRRFGIASHDVFFRGRDRLWIDASSLDASKDARVHLHPIQGVLLHLDEDQSTVPLLRSDQPFLGLIPVNRDQILESRLCAPLAMTQANAGRFNLPVSIDDRLITLQHLIVTDSGAGTAPQDPRELLELGISKGIIFSDEVGHDSESIPR